MAGTELDNFIHSGFANRDMMEQMYWKYRQDPSQVSEAWRRTFDEIDSIGEAVPVARATTSDARVYHLIEAYRTYGHLMAKINPIMTHTIEEPWQLKLENLGFRQEELDQQFPTYGLLEKPTATLEEIIQYLRDTYCGNIGIEYMGVQDPKLEQWVQQHIEPNRFKIALTIDQKKMILQHLNKSELFEAFLHTKFVGQKRFSLEGGETLIPILAATIDKGAQLEMEECILGMAHRGRLNVLSNIMDKSYSQIFSEFEEGYIPLSFEGSGDVKYHKGFSATVTTQQGREVNVALAPNPSHLEAVNSVVEGQVLARQILKNDLEKEQVVPILIHGDAAIAGQGIIYEALQFYNLNGYSTGGTVHIVINNQIGFTTSPKDGRSTRYCTDIAQTFNSPVFHVNAEDPEGCVYATYLAMEMRQKFHCDVFIDLNCYRKYGHNEADEPAFTQPIEYKIIRKKKPIRELYRDDLIQRGVLERQMAEALEVEFKASLQEALAGTQTPISTEEPEPKPEMPAEVKDLFKPFPTGIPKETLQDLAQKFCRVPEGLTVHKKLERLIAERLAMAEGQRPIDWGMGETLAYATLLQEGNDIRLSGQDCCRGTFSHRHAMWMDQVAERAYYPLQHVADNQGRFDVYNSSLSEYGVLGFEYGYSLGNPKTLVIWEAQFGDFCNGAQVIIDQFISTGEMKWGQKNSLVMFLPHGYEGQGPEHSSARMERFLSLCGNENLQVVYPSLPAQHYHLLRRQVLKPTEKPLIVFTPKGLLRHPHCVSELSDFTEGAFQEILDDPVPPKKAKRLLFCSGRIFYDLLEERSKRGVDDLAMVRVEQLYPFHKKRTQEILEKYKGFKSFYWVQEEPKNMGAWNFVRPILRKLLPKGISPQYIGRARSASPAAGSYALHKKEHAEIIEELFGKSEIEAKA